MMKGKKGVVVIVILLAVCSAGNAHAQFWKGLFRKREAPRNYEKTMPKKEEPPVMRARPAVRKVEIEYPATKIKRRYRIDVLVQLYLNDADAGRKLMDHSVTGLEFYKGIKLATDTLNSFNYNMDVYVHDIGSAPTTPSMLIKNKTLDSADLIIGAVQGFDVSLLAEYARKHKVNFVSALSPSDVGVKNNPYFILQQATLQVHCNHIMNTIEKKFPKREAIVFYRTSAPLDHNAFNCIQKDSNIVGIRKVLCNALPTKEDIAPYLSDSKENIIIITVLDNGYAETLLKLLYELFPEHKFEVYGMPSWKTIPSLNKADAYPNIAVHITTPFYYDASTPNVRNVERAYHQEFGGKPNEITYRAYETLYWYAYLLAQYGTIFNNNMSDNSAALFNKFDVKPEWDKEANLLYNENEHLYMLRYQNSSFTIEQ
ncbi:MAG: hypothetical protein H0X33_10960 [Taibaiella sp.]|nr:hypothetical protein [Taibaiella sp.]